jgi:hypothetical protein
MDNYLEKYVLAPKSEKGNGGAGIERHDFHHLVKSQEDICGQFYQHFTRIFLY